MFGFTTLMTVYNINRISSIIGEIYQIQDINDKLYLEERLIELKGRILESGCIGIKFTQWFITKIKTCGDELNNTIVKYFEDIFDNCPQHSLEYSKSKFLEEFKIPLENIIEIESLEIIGSGSIGQVYKGILKGLNKPVAIKVKHPDVMKSIDNIEPLINILTYLQSYNYFRNRYNLYLDFGEFLDDLKMQVDFTNEVYNSITFGKNYEDNNHVIIPKVYYYTSNIIIFEYVGGVSYSTLEDYAKSQVSLNLISFFEESLMVHNFIHCDLHEKNWSVLYEDGVYKLIIYDYGICYRSKSAEFARELWDCFETNNSKKLIEIARNNIIVDDFSQEIADEIEIAINHILKTNVNSHYILSKIINILSKRENVKFNKIAINLIIYFSMIEKILKENNIVCNSNCSSSNPEKVIYNLKMNILSYGKAYNVYHKLGKYIENTLDGVPENYTLFVDTENSDLTFISLD